MFGDYPEIVKKNAGERLPAFTRYESERVKGSFDFIGVNHYYTVSAKNIGNTGDVKSGGFAIDMAVDLICKTSLLKLGHFIYMFVLDFCFDSSPVCFKYPLFVWIGCRRTGGRTV